MTAVNVDRFVEMEPTEVDPPTGHSRQFFLDLPVRGVEVAARQTAKYPHDQGTNSRNDTVAPSGEHPRL